MLSYRQRHFAGRVDVDVGLRLNPRHIPARNDVTSLQWRHGLRVVLVAVQEAFLEAMTGVEVGADDATFGGAERGCEKYMYEKNEDT